MQENYKELLEKISGTEDSVVKLSDLKKGVWCVKEIPNGTQMYYVLERVDDLPESIDLLQMEDLRYDLSRAITDYLIALDPTESVLEEFKNLHHLGVSVRGIVTSIFNRLLDVRRKNKRKE